VVEGARLESVYAPTRCIEGSNPFLSARIVHFEKSARILPNFEQFDFQALFFMSYSRKTRGWINFLVPIFLYL
jgi:hypothetical protein